MMGEIIMEINKHKVFISYYHDEDQPYKDYLCDVLNFDHELFDDYSVRDGEIDDELDAETIRTKIRDEYIKEATVLVLLCGPNTKHRKYIDWEIHASMYDTEKNPKMGIIVVNLPKSGNGVRAASNIEKEVISPNSSWTSFTTLKQFEDAYSSAPKRIINSLFYKQSEISFVDWETIKNNPNKLKLLIDIAYSRRKDVDYYLADPLMRRNGN